MKKAIVLLFLLLQYNGVSAQDYNCVLLDSLISTIEIKKAQNDILIPLFKSGELKTDGDSIYIITKDEVKIHKIDSVLRQMDIKEGNLFLQDELFSLDTFNIIIDTFNFINSSCNLNKHKNNRYLIVNDYSIINDIKTSPNIIVVEKIAYNNNGAISIVLRNTKSTFGVIFGIRKSSVSYPSITILGKYIFDPEQGIILE